MVNIGCIVFNFWFLNFRDDERLVHFWKNVLYEYTYAVSESFTLNAADLSKKFILYNRVPCGLP